MNYFYVEFKQSKEYLKLADLENVSATTQKTMEKIVEKILSLILDNPRITQKQLMHKIGLSRRGVEWNLKKLKKEGKNC